MIEIKDGDWVVEKGSWRIECRQATRATKEMFFYTGYGNKERRSSRSLVVFAGPEATAKKVAERLTSSDALCNEDKSKAYARREDRDKKIIADAYAAKAA